MYVSKKVDANSQTAQLQQEYGLRIDAIVNKIEALWKKRDWKYSKIQAELKKALPVYLN